MIWVCAACTGTTTDLEGSMDTFLSRMQGIFIFVSLTQALVIENVLQGPSGNSPQSSHAYFWDM